MKKTPLSRVNDEFGGKDKLVDAIASVVEGDEDKGSLKKRLQSSSNSKLLRLHSVATRVKELGGRAKVLDAILTLQNRAKDKDYTAKLQAYTTARLLDVYTSSDRAAKRDAAAPKRAAKPKKKGRAA